MARTQSLDWSPIAEGDTFPITTTVICATRTMREDGVDSMAVIQEEWMRVCAEVGSLVRPTGLQGSVRDANQP